MSPSVRSCFGLPLALTLGAAVCTAALLVPAAAQFGPGTSAASSDALDSIVAVIDNDIVTRSELDQALAAARAQLRGRKARVPPDSVLERQVLERLLLEQLQVRAAERRGISIDDPTLNAAVESIAGRNKMTLEKLRQAVERDGLSFRRYREQIRRELLANRLRQREVDSRITVSEQEIDNVLGSAANAREYRLAHLLLPLSESAAPAAVERVGQRARQIIQRLSQGEDFARLAAAESAGKEALNGGDLGWRSRSQLPGLFVDAAQRLQPGEVSTPLRSASGVHILKLVGVRKAQLDSADAEQARQVVREQLQRRKADEEWQLWLRRLRDESYVEVRL